MTNAQSNASDLEEDEKRRERWKAVVAVRRKCLRDRLAERYWSRSRAAQIIAGIDPDRTVERTGEAVLDVDPDKEFGLEDVKGGVVVEDFIAEPISRVRTYTAWGWLPNAFRPEWRNAGLGLDERVEAEIAYAASQFRAKKEFPDLGDRPPAQWIDHARDRGYVIPWIDFAMQDKGCRDYLSEDAKRKSRKEAREDSYALGKRFEVKQRFYRSAYDEVMRDPPRRGKGINKAVNERRRDAEDCNYADAHFPAESTVKRWVDESFEEKRISA